MTNEEINKLAAESMGLCVYVSTENGLIPYDHHHKQPYDFCNDLNAAQKIARTVEPSELGMRILAVFGIYTKTEDGGFVLNCAELGAMAATISPKTLTILTLWAKEKITQEEALDALEQAKEANAAK